MSHKPKILALAGSTRSESFNKKVSKIAAEAAKETGADVTWIDLRDFPMPLYDGDLEEKEGLPQKAKELKQLFIASDGFLIASPEYNSSISGVLKNAIDWVSRTESDDEPDLIAFKGKAASIMSVSVGQLGGLRGLVTLRSILGNIGVLVLPDQKSLPKAQDCFDASGKLTSERDLKGFQKMGKQLAEFLIKYKG